MAALSALPAQDGLMFQPAGLDQIRTFQAPVRSVRVRQKQSLTQQEALAGKLFIAAVDRCG